MRKSIALLSVVLAFTLLSTAVLGCGEASKEGTTTSREADIEWLRSYINDSSSSNPDFDHNDFDRIDFATDDQGNEWALVMTKSYYKGRLSEGLFEAHVFEKVNGEWTRISGGSGGFSEGVPAEVQKDWGIEGQ